MPDTAQLVINAIRDAINVDKAVLHEPCFSGNESKYTQECIDSTFVSSVGKYVDRFESDLVSYTGSGYAIAVANGTSALHIALILAGVKSNDEVLIPALSFIATANAVHYCGAYPHFVESEEASLGIDADAIRDYLQSISEIKQGYCINRITGRIIRAIVPMHTFGHPVEIEKLLSLAHDFNLVLVEDAAESLGSQINSVHTGTFGLLGILSFNGNKTITTGGGGAILTKNRALALHAKHLTTTAKIPHKWEYFHDEIGFNYRLPNINAALGCAQLERLPALLKAKRSLYVKYLNAFKNLKKIHVVSERAGTTSNYWLQTIVLDKSIKNERDEILARTNDAGYMTRPVWKLLNELPPYRICPAMELSVAKSLSERLINLPSSAQLAFDS